VANEQPGPGVDAQGRPIADPTENVKDLMEAAVTRLDDLREMETRHQDRIRILMMGHVSDMAALRADLGEKLRNAETDRINAIRAVDVAAVQRAAEVADLRAQTLAAQVAQSAETLRVQVAAVAAASATELTRALEPIQRAIDDLRKSQYEAQGMRGQVIEQRSASGASVALVGLGISILLALIVVITVVVSRGGA
jgi:hypothetical protein